ncbi:hypothetical protein M406DRAFT_73813 [Cryphonectria parasitica EP155]|uniref:Uncharacterized protein n=1 Tax=Cryphonectria parasitica (strain ATCC 38755 / EP155) TaxID=660469 RepID=A0A9P4XYD1_CRYP1|nr:uncharacterized protein M406DRAFT_73813 [Cryphonectria parasitica EP155]KAF3763186.1 hypothetical protein M406DRAFT_73813 [Cryphonectria parasitica EP155]
MKFTSISFPVLLQALLLGTAQSTMVFSYNQTASSPNNTKSSEIEVTNSCDLTPFFGPSTYKCAAEPMSQARICAGDELSRVTAMVMADQSAPTCMAGSFGLTSGY